MFARTSGKNAECRPFYILPVSHVHVFVFGGDYKPSAVVLFWRGDVGDVNPSVVVLLFGADDSLWVMICSFTSPPHGKSNKRNKRRWCGGDVADDRQERVVKILWRTRVALTAEISLLARCR